MSDGILFFPDIMSDRFWKIICSPAVRDKLHQVGEVKNFVVDCKVLESCKTAHARSQAEDKKRKMKKIEETKKAEKEARKKTELQRKKLELDNIKQKLKVI